MTEPSLASQSRCCSPSCKIFVILALALICAKVAVFFALGKAHLIWDSHWYLALAKNLIHSAEYTLGDGAFHAKYPPGFPVSVAALGLLFGNYEAAASAIVLGSSIALCFLTYILGLRYSVSGCGKPGTIAAVSAMLFAVHHLALVHSNLILTEQLFSLCALGSLAVMTRKCVTAKNVVMAVLLAGFASLTRYEGILLFPVLGYCWLRVRHDAKDVPSAPVVCALGVVGLAWGIWMWSLASHGASPLGGGYGGELADMSFDRALDFALLGFWLGPYFLLFTMAGAIKLLRHPSLSTQAFATFAFLYLICHLCWWFSDLRFYLVVVPLFSICAAVALVALANAMTRGHGFIRLSALTVLLASLAWEQRAMFQAQSIEYRRYNSLYLHQYDLIEDLTAWSLGALPNATFAVPEVTVYAHYLPKSTLISYDQLAQALSKGDKKIYLIIDNVHFKNDAIQGALGGTLKIADSSGALRELPTKVLHKTSSHLTPDDDKYAAIVEIQPPL